MGRSRWIGFHRYRNCIRVYCTAEHALVRLCFQCYFIYDGVDFYGQRLSGKAAHSLQFRRCPFCDHYYNPLFRHIIAIYSKVAFFYHRRAFPHALGLFYRQKKARNHRNIEGSKMSRISPKIGLWITTILWVCVIAGLWAKNEYQLTHGKEILLKTAPVDPRDLFRGDYVVLRYEISSLNLDSLEQDDLYLKRNSVIFVDLAKKNGYWHATKIHTEIPANGIFLRGQVTRVYNKTVEIKYGIESYFVPEGEGKKIEQQYADRKVDVVVAVSPYGQGLLKGLKISERKN